jgi:hypothetical protein
MLGSRHERSGSMQRKEHSGFAEPSLWRPKTISRGPRELKESAMAKDAYDSGVTAEQRQEIRRLCQEAGVPDKSGELFTHETAQRFIEDMRRKVAEH